MTLSDIKGKYPEVKELYDIIEEYEIKFLLLPVTPALKGAYFREIQLSTPSIEFTIPVDDELDDANSENPALLLQLIIYAIEEYEDCEDFLVWSTAYGLDASNPTHINWYKRLGKITPAFRKIIRADVAGISDYDWQLNAGAAQALRELDQ
ncbi:MAG: hypothetical protein JJ971_03695 [Balneolaceae bacterium]|nr:hypothetical protein [Balneolaceae bacterium]MBO6545476.1 hypothetical protein [Balneolaceae bacterium]MBO6646872.1 hypothetical protein [Balneolaceae bacterium]